jgi:radical SAM superfamily enzyme YgiQ (UPF0313 family)
MLTEMVLATLKHAGLHSCTFALESANADTRVVLLNRQVTDTQIKAGVKLLQQYGIKYRIENMLGLPHETLDDALATLDYNIACRPAIAWASLYTPYFGTKLGNYCRDKDLIETTKWGADFFTHASLKLPRKKQIERIQKLFALICAMPMLRCLLPWLIRLPLNYQRVYQWAKQYLYKHRLYKC